MSDSATRQRWTRLWHRLGAIRLEPLPTQDEAETVLAALPPRLPDEPLRDWLARAKTPAKPADPSSSLADEER